MHPTFSVIAFTTAAGAGLALLFLVAIGEPLALLPPSAWFGVATLGIAFVLTVGGLVASVFHLGRPERAWRAFSQWRSSWLSREGVLSVATFVPAAVFAIGWVIFGARAGGVGFAGFLAAMLAAATVYSTGMIYASLKPIRQWHNPWTAPNYLLLALMSGFLLLDFVLRFWRVAPVGTASLTFVAIAFAWGAKEAYWRSIDTERAASTVASATALGRRGRVRLLEPPHTQDNYLLQEMGYRIARKHRARLRWVARATLFVLPAVLTLVALFAARAGGEIAAAVAIATAALGLVIERWLFFAEAQHTVMLYYGAEAV
ncbi:MAG TPA: DmsC/YnfH family molybdoenzyme membrane anchor subunit [Stellaceae bacterium]|nr:DmsC/YnfH family molybdoenzyme membrane anchor subunit [Stellaceae bacterium]